MMIVKLLKKRILILPILLGMGLFLGFISSNFGQLYMTLVSWVVIQALLLTYLKHNQMIEWHGKSTYSKVKEAGIIVLLSLLFIWMLDSIFLVISLFLTQLYMIVMLAETGEETFQLSKSHLSLYKMTGKERENFLLRQKLNYPKANAETEISIIQNEKKIQEIIKLKTNLEEAIATKEAKLKLMIDEIEMNKRNKQDYAHLKNSIEKTEIEKSELQKKRQNLSLEKQKLEQTILEMKFKLAEQQKKTDDFKVKSIKLTEKLKVNEETLQEERNQKQYLENEQVHLKKALETKYAEIERIAIEKLSFEEERKSLQSQISQLIKELKQTNDRKVITDQLEKRITQLYEKIREKDSNIAKFVLDSELLVTEKAKLEVEYEKYSQAVKILELRIKEKDQEFKKSKQAQKKLYNELEYANHMNDEYEQEVDRLLNDLVIYEQLVSENDLQLNELNQKNTVIADNENKLIELANQLEEMKEERDRQKIFVEQLRLTTENTFLFSTKENPSKKSMSIERLTTLYPNLDFTTRFFNQFKQLNMKEQLAIESKLSKLHFDNKNVKFRPNSINLYKGSAVLEMAYDIEGQKGVGKGRIYCQNRRVLAISRTEADQARIIAWIKNEYKVSASS